MKKKTHITLYDIAKRLNVSKVTVSKALRGHPDISRETTKEVKKIAEELGYTPNFAARNLSSQKSNTIGVVVPKIAHFFFSSVIEAIYDAAFNNNYDIALMVSQEDSSREKKHIDTLLAMRVDGIIVSITQQTKDKAIFEKVLSRNVPLVFMDRVVEMKGTSQVTVDDRGGAFNAVEQAIRKGYKKIAHLGGYREINIGKDRYAGFVDAMKQYDLPVNPGWVVFGGFGEDNGYNGFMEFYRTGNMPEFIFAVTYPVALGVYTAAAEVGMKIPDDIDLICFGNSSVSRFIKPEISYVNQPTDVLGKTAVDLVLEHIRDYENYRPKRIQIPTNLVLRETCVKKKGVGLAVIS
ncbi:MAG TPA: LacI family DNA-binding transcriptional regulator [Candidatus Acidoferrales bacterium]|nr:LacI family DNA-binding transcriptional regulator [Candidatus Acidoferrales bacterium]